MKTADVIADFLKNLSLQKKKQNLHRDFYLMSDWTKQNVRVMSCHSNYRSFYTEKKCL